MNLRMDIFRAIGRRDKALVMAGIGVEYPKRRQRLGQFVRREFQLLAQQGLAMCGDIRQMVGDELADFALPGRVVELVHLRQQTFARIAPAATRRIELEDSPPHGLQSLFRYAGRHQDVGIGTVEHAGIGDVGDQNLRQYAALFIEIRKRYLREQVFLQGLGAALGVEQALPPRRGLLVAAGGFHVAEEIVEVAILRAQDVLGGSAFRREIQFHVAIRRRLAGVFLGRGDRQLRFAWIAHIFDDRILLHLLAQFGGKIKRSHLKHLQRLSHLRRQRLRLGETLRQVISWTGHVEDIIS